MEFSAQQIADLLKGEIIGDATVKVCNLSKIEEGKPETLSFLANPKYTQYIYTTEASIVLVNRDFVPEAPVPATLIKVDDAYASIALLLNMISEIRNQRSGIDKECYISENAQVGEHCYIGAFAYLGNHVKIGNNCKIYPQVYIGDNVRIGDNVTLYPGVKIYHECLIGSNCTLHAGVVIGADGFGFAPQGESYIKIAQIGNVEIEDDVEIGANATIDRATMGSTRIRKGVKIDNLVQLAHNVEVGSHTVMAAQCGVAGSTKIGEHCIFAGQVGVAGHIIVGDCVTVGAQSGIPNNVADHQMILGYPAQPAREFAKSTVMIKKLPELNQMVKELKKEIESLKKQINK